MLCVAAGTGCLDLKLYYVELDKNEEKDEGKILKNKSAQHEQHCKRREGQTDGMCARACMVERERERLPNSRLKTINTCLTSLIGLPREGDPFPPSSTHESTSDHTVQAMDTQKHVKVGRGICWQEGIQ